MNRQAIFGIVGLAILVAVWHGEVQAVSIVNQPLDLTAGGAGFTSTAGGQQIAEPFSLLSPAIATEVSFSGWFSDNQTFTASFDILFFDNIGGLSGNLIFLHNTGDITGTFVGIDGDVGPQGVDVYEWSITIPAVQFTSAGTFWISIRDTDPRSPVFQWEHSNPNVDNEVVSRNQNTGNWTTQSVTNRNDTQAVTIGGAFLNPIPEPSTLLLLFTGLAGLGFFSKHRKQVSR